eukprot:TRINITY_DN54492_c0_g1_i1.p1 TRINITY_DN54492_c0_g1~~TRINITY_DN54492_c0_g1_i1.p1  ORF type:complete len:638 (-),score=36.14 TRINITY_DN54492_c0_g1_i1:77-1990(-)
MIRHSQRQTGRAFGFSGNLNVHAYSTRRYYRAVRFSSTTVRIGNCSGFYGDKLSAAKEMVRSKQIDVLTGDYLAELTMAILHTQQTKGGGTGGYVATFLLQMQQVLGECLQQGVRVVSNAGGLDPKGLAEQLQKLVNEAELVTKDGKPVKIAYVLGDNVKPYVEQALQENGNLNALLTNLDTGESLATSKLPLATANAYNGGWGITKALQEGADVVITGRVADAALVTGPAAWKHGWTENDWDKLAGALVAGHVIECGCQCTGGNYAFWKDEFPRLDNIGFPIAEIDVDGNSIIRSTHPQGRATVGSVTSQLLYEIGNPLYPSPDVTARFDTMQLSQITDDTVKISGVKGMAPPTQLKVCINHIGGYRNTMTFILCGLDIEQKAQLIEEAVWNTLGGKDRFAQTHVNLSAVPPTDPQSWEQAMAYLRITIKDTDKKKVSRQVTAKVIGLALAHYPGFVMAPTAPTEPTPFAIYWPTTVDRQQVHEEVKFVEEETPIAVTQRVTEFSDEFLSVTPDEDLTPWVEEETQLVALGELFGARSGDKGGNCNLGVWARNEQQYRWLVHNMTPERLKQLLPECRDLKVDRYRFDNLLGVNFVVYGLLAPGAAGNALVDPWAKSFGEYWRSKAVLVPRALLLSP